MFRLNPASRLDSDQKRDPLLLNDHHSEHASLHNSYLLHTIDEDDEDDVPGGINNKRKRDGFCSHVFGNGDRRPSTSSYVTPIEVILLGCLVAIILLAAILEVVSPNAYGNGSFTRASSSYQSIKSFNPQSRQQAPSEQNSPMALRSTLPSDENEDSTDSVFQEAEPELHSNLNEEEEPVQSTKITEGRRPWWHSGLRPSKVPNGDLVTGFCDGSQLEYGGAMNLENGTNAYPQLFPVLDVLENWNVESPDVPKATYNSLCRFDFSDSEQRAVALLYRNKHVPFIMYNVPGLNKLRSRWSSDEYVADIFNHKQQAVMTSPNAHFMYHNLDMLPDQTTPGTTMMTYEEFARITEMGKNAGPQDPHFYFYATSSENGDQNAEAIESEVEIFQAEMSEDSGLGSENEEEHQLKLEDLSQPDLFETQEEWEEALETELADLETRKEDNAAALLEHQFFIYDKESAAKSGTHCRFGMRGVISENHYDVGLNFVAVIRGQRRYILSPPSMCNNAYTLKSGASARHSPIDWAQPGLAEQYPKVRKLKVTEAVLSEGEILFIPSLWYHFIVSVDRSIQCNRRSGVTKYGEDFLDKCDNDDSILLDLAG